MKLGKTAASSLWLAGALLLSGCQYPKYATYISRTGDFKCQVPYSWNVKTDAEGGHFANATFIGPFEADFFLGVPSFSVRWYSRLRLHRLPDGTLETYSGADDYIRQTLENVYGPKAVMRQEVHEVEVANRKAKHFVVLSPVVVPKTTRWGTSVDAKTQELVNLRQHSYVVVPMEGGFYVLIYPATRDGFPKYEKEFNQMVNSFLPLKDGPQGPPVALR